MKKIFILGTVLVLFISQLFAVDFSNENQSRETGSKILRIPVPTEKENVINPNEYVVGVGDQFIVEMILEKTSMIIPVLSSGELSVPGIAVLDINGLLLRDAIEFIEKAIGEYANVSLYEVKKIRIPVVGAVIKPGIYSVSASSRISDLLKFVPLRYLSKDFEINIITDDDTNIVNIYEFNLKGDRSQNPYISQGQTIYIPFADPVKECVEVYGPVMVKSFVPFIKGESLGDFYRRKIVMSDVMNYEKIMVNRNDQQIIVMANEMDKFILQAKDKIEFIALEKIMVSGHVNRPGTYEFVPGHTVVDYISMAGGANYKGSANSAVVIRDSKKIRDTDNLNIKRGDIILVKRSAEDVFIGEISILSFVSMLATIASTVITAFIAAGNI